MLPATIPVDGGSLSSILTCPKSFRSSRGFFKITCVWFHVLCKQQRLMAVWSAWRHYRIYTAFSSLAALWRAIMLLQPWSLMSSKAHSLSQSQPKAKSNDSCYICNPKKTKKGCFGHSLKIHKHIHCIQPLKNLPSDPHEAYTPIIGLFSHETSVALLGFRNRLFWSPLGQSLKKSIGMS